MHSPPGQPLLLGSHCFTVRKLAIVEVNTIARKAAFYTTTARFIAFVGSLPSANQQLWIPDDLTTPLDWVSPPLLTLRSIHTDLLAKFNCTEDQPIPAQTPSQDGS